MAELRATGLVLRGVLHAAGVLDDGLLKDQTPPRFATVLSPKVLGAWHLHEATRAEALDWFVLYSSVSAALGNAGQGSYAAANGFLDGLAALRRAQGLPGLSIAWGPWAEVGMAASLERRESMRLASGISALATADGIAALALLLGGAASYQVVMSVDWARLGALGATPPLLSRLVERRARTVVGKSALRDELARLERGARSQRLQAYLAQSMAAVLGVAAVEASKPFREMGLDSLMTVEARNRLMSELGVRLSPTVLFDYPNIEALSAHLEGLLFAESAGQPSSTQRRKRSATHEPIAIIGIGCRFPGGAHGPEAYWRMLSAGVDATREVPSERWDAKTYYDPTPATPGKTNTKRGAFLEGIDQFAADFFDIPPSQAAYIDPQHRLALEVVWEALADAGIAPPKLAGSQTGLFVGQMTHDYAHLINMGFSNLGVGSGRVSYAFDLRGPSETIDVQCASSLATVHRASEALRAGECSLAVAGGTNALLAPAGFVFLSQVTASSADGRCKTFDERADGYGRGEGSGFVVLKRLSDAERDGDFIYAVVLGSAVHHGGRGQGFTVPNGLEEEALLTDVLQRSSIDSRDIAYLEAHGTGTSLGDPIEAEAVARAYAGRDGVRLPVSSTKTNFGHLEGAAGIAGLIKATLVLHHGEVPPHLHLFQTNPHIALDALPLTVPTERRPLRRARIAGVSSFGMSGTLAHALLGAAPRRAPVRREARAVPATPRASALVLSAKSAVSLRALAGRYAALARRLPEGELSSLCASAARGEANLAHRLVWVGSDARELAGALTAFAGQKEAPSLLVGTARGEAAALGWVITELPGAGLTLLRELAASSPVFRAAVERCAPAAHRYLGVSLLDDAAPSRVPAELSAVTQLAVAYGLASVWEALGPAPSFLAGVGIGEYVAAVLAGVMRLDDAVMLAVERAKAMTGGAEALAGFELRASAVAYERPRLGLVASLTGALAEGEACASGQYWRRQLAEPAALEVTVQGLVAAGARLLVTPDVALRASRLDGAEWLGLDGAPSLWGGLLQGLGAWWARGGEVRWQLLGRGRGEQRTALPLYAFERRRFWADASVLPVEAARDVGRLLLGHELVTPDGLVIFDQELAPGTALLRDHRVYEGEVVPGAAFVEMALSAARTLGLSQLSIERPLVLSEVRRVQVHVRAKDDGAEIEVFSAAADAARPAWTLHAQGKAALGGRLAEAEPLAVVRARAREPLEVRLFYSRLAESGLGYGPGYRALTGLWRGEDEVLGKIDLPEAQVPGAELTLHPSVLDGCLQLAAALPPPAGAKPGLIFLPVGFEQLSISRTGLTELWCHVRRVEATGQTSRLELALHDGAERLVGTARVVLRAAPREAMKAAQPRAARRAQYVLEWLERPLAEPGAIEPRSWVVLADGGPLAAGLLAALRGAGSSCVVVERGSALSITTPEQPWQARDTSDDVAAVLRAAAEAAGGEAAPLALIDLWSASGGADVEGAEAAARTSLAVAQGVLRSQLKLMQVVGVTRGAEDVGEDADLLAIGDAPLIGFYRALRREQSAHGWKTVDLEASGDPAQQAALLAAEVRAPDGEDEVALRRGRRWVPRLAALRAVLPPAGAYQLVAQRQGMLDSLAWESSERRAPAAGEIEMRIAATGLNFRDVLNALGMYPGAAGALGGDVTGVVERVSEGVTHLSPGDRIVALVSGGLASHATLDARCAARLPAALSLNDGTTIPSTFLTVQLGLMEQAGLSRGERVLVHAGTGGVGLAAIQLAQRAGAEVFATAGSEAKRKYLRSLGVRYVYDSRTLAFADELLRDTGGEGVHAVLNSLSGEFIAKSVAVLAPGGRFVEIGKRDIWSHDQMHATRPDVAYHIVALDILSAQEPAEITRLFSELLPRFATGELTALPQRRFGYWEAEAAFRHMQAAKHVGKIVLRQPRDARPSADAVHVVTGGLGGVGLEVLRWLAASGARDVVVVSRRTPSAAQQAELSQAAGLQPRYVSLDVADAGAVRRFFEATLAGGRRLGGVFHCAGVLEDGLLGQQSWERFAKVYAPKIRGAWNLHSALLELGATPELFVLFSSVSGLLGNAGQSNYAGANAFLDALAAHRQRRGQPALSIQWGPWATGGMAQALAASGAFEASGIRPMSGAAAIQAMTELLGEPLANAAVVDADFSQMVAVGGKSPLLQKLAVEPPASKRAPVDSRLAAEIAALPPAARLEELERRVRGELTKVMGEAANGVAVDQPLMEAGIDSLMAVELRRRLSELVGKALPATIAFDYPTVRALAGFLLKTLALSEATAVESRPSPSRASARTAMNEGIAIVGMSCRLPGGANDPKLYWRLLRDRRDGVSEVPRERWDVERYYDPDPDAPGKMNTRWGGFLRDMDVGEFEPSFFGISAAEAEWMDPQQRLLLEVAWEALEDAGIAASQLSGSRTGVFVGIATQDYFQLRGGPEAMSTYTGTGAAHSVAAGRLSFVLGLQGPAMAVDTACSSSLYALHHACQTLRSGEADAALVGGVNLLLAPEATIYFSKGHFMAPDGHCKTFDASADGYVRSEGVAMVVLKRLSDAERDGDRILAVVRGSALNQDGRSAGLTAPNGPSQEAVIRQALGSAGFEPADIDYVEAHGTGTQLGDPIEVGALGAVMGERPIERSLALASVKTSVGHLEAAAGMASLVKVVLALQHEELPAHRNLATLSSKLGFEDKPLAIPTRAVAWVSGSRRRRAGLSGFAFQGSNAHVVVEEAPALRSRPEAPARSEYVLVLSARTRTALQVLARRWREALSAAPLDLADACYTAAVGRVTLGERLAIVASSREVLVERLSMVERGEAGDGIFVGQAQDKGARISAPPQGADAAALAEHWVKGAPIDWKAFFGPEARRLSLPTYPFERKRFWVAPSTRVAESGEVERTYETPRGELVYEAPLTYDGAGALDDHRLYGDIVVPGSWHLVRMAYAAKRLLAAPQVKLHDALFLKALPIRPGERYVWSLSLTPGEDGRYRAQVSTRLLEPEVETSWTIRATADLTVPSEPFLVEAPARPSEDDGWRQLPVEGFYDKLWAVGYHLGARFRWVEQAWLRGEDLVVELAAQSPEVAADAAGVALQVGALDSAFQSRALTADEKQQEMFVPMGLATFTVGDAAPAARYLLHIQLGANRSMSGRCVTAAGAPAFEFSTLSFVQLKRENLQKNLGQNDKVAGWLYTIDLEPVAVAAAPTQASGAWLVCGATGAEAWANAVSAELSRRGAVCAITSGASPEALAAALAEAARSGGGALAGVVVLVPEAGEPTEAAALWSSAEQRYGLMVRVVQALAGASLKQAGRLRVVTQGAVARGTDERLVAPVGAGAWALARVVGAEYPELQCRRVDVAAADAPEAVAPSLVDELLRDDAETDVALRGGARLVGRLKRSQPPSGAALSVQKDGAYLITGGLGGLGLWFAEVLSRAGAGAVALVGRRPPSDEARRAIAALEARGTRVLALACDVSRRDELEAVLTRVRAELPPLKGVIHAAGVLDDGMLRTQSWERFATVLAPKLLGGWHLHELLRDQPLDWFALFSSVASALGNAGQANYAAANGFLDGLAGYRRALDLPAVSINWGPWAEIGMAAAAGTAVRAGASTAIDPEGGARAFALALASGVAQQVALPMDWERLAATLGGRRPPFLSAVLGAPPRRAVAEGKSPVRDELSGLEPAERRARLLEHLIRTVSGVLGVDTIAPSQPFRDLGMDSMMTVEVRNRLVADLGVRLSPTLLFDYPTMEALTGHLDGQLFGDLATKVVAAKKRTRAVSDEPIAIIGMACRFPGGGNDPALYWRILRDGKDGVSEVPPDRWDVDAYYDPNPDAPGKMNTRWGGFLRDMDVAEFEPTFFGISPAEAEWMDPQQRLLLEVAWEAMEDAGLPASEMVGTRTGVFVGISTQDYFQERSAPESMSTYAGTGAAHSVAAGRVSYVFGLQGAAMAVDTACSSSLYALHHACQTLRAGDADAALVGGVNLLLAPGGTVYFSKGRFMAPDGRCKTFDTKADGYVRSEGVGIVVLKRLSDAERDGDRILALVRGSALNQDGRSAGLTAPNGPSQEAVIRHALSVGGLEPADVDYIEAHGTGTQLGDPIEIGAVDAVIGERPLERQLAITSVKTSIGHLEAAAGMASIIKVVLALGHEELPAHRNLKTVSSRLELDDKSLVIPTRRTPWLGGGDRPRRAGLSGFAFQGSNAHVVVEEAPRARAREATPERPQHVLILSARTPTALAASVRRYQELLARGDVALGDVCFTASTGRVHFAERLAVVGVDAGDVGAKLAAAERAVEGQGVFRGREQPQKLAWVVGGGAGERLVAAARRLHVVEPAFKAAIDECAGLLGAPKAGLEGILAGLEVSVERERAAFVLRFAMARLWQSLGVSPAWLTGFGVGEYVVAVVAGVMRLEDGLALALARGKALAAGSTPEALDAFERVASGMSFGAPRVRVVAGLSGALAQGEGALGARYWCRQLVESARAREALAELARLGAGTLLDLDGELDAAILPAGVRQLACVGDGEPTARLAWALAAYWSAGGQVDWKAVAKPWGHKKIALPTYPFERQRFWIDVNPAAPARESAAEESGDLYEVLWRPVPAPAAEVSCEGDWLVLCDAGGVGSRLAAELERRGGRCTRVYWREAAADGRAVRDLGELEALVSGSARSWRGVVHLWSLAHAEAAPTAEHTELLLGLARLVKNLSGGAKLHVLTRGAEAVRAGESPRAAMALVWGFGRGAALEHPGAWGGMVDLDVDAELDPARLILELVRPDDEAQVAWRGEQRFVPRLVARAAPASAPLSLSATKTFVVSGGLGGVGLAVARWLASRGARRLVLLGRKGLGARDGWDALAPSSQEAQAVGVIRELEAQGAAVEVVACDVADRQALARVLEGARRRGPLGGVVHAAGVALNVAIADLERDVLEQQLAAKVHGGWNLHELTQDDKLEVFVLFSSIAAVWGNIRQAAYAAANHFMDALASYRRAQGQGAIAIDLGPVADVGMLQKESWGASVEEYFRRGGITPLPVATVLTSVERLLAADVAQGMVARFAVEQFAAGYEASPNRSLLRELQKKRASGRRGDSALARELLALAGEPRRARMMAFVSEAVLKTLSVEASRLTPSVPLRDLGLESLMAVELGKRLGDGLGAKLPPTLLFDYPTVEALTTYLLTEVVAGEQAAERVARGRDVSASEPIAIIGMSCRLPGAASPEAFWQLLRGGVDATRETPRQRFDADAFYDPQRGTPGRLYSRRGGFVEDMDLFDAGFFGISPVEARSLDPQQRLLLETSWEALERAGVDVRTLRGSRTGVYIGIQVSEYSSPTQLGSSPYGATGVALNAAAGRLSYFYDLWGPAEAVDTACSSSLVALHQACQSLRAGEVEMALAGGVNALLTPYGFIALSQAQALAADGRCKTFDADADGYGRGEGCGVFVLKRLSDAERDGDDILAVVRGTAVNQDGRSQGLTAPNGLAQRAVIRQALDRAGLSPADVDYVDAHGTGTPLGDPIEVRAMASVYAGERGARPLALGSVKTNLGHLESAAGVASVMKLVLCLQGEELVPHLNLRRVNPYIDLDELGLGIVTRTAPWPRQVGRSRVVAASGFGFTGTNAHVIIEEGPQRASPPAAERPVDLFLISARTPTALAARVQQAIAYLEAGAAPWADVCYTSRAHRSALEHRVAVVAGDAVEARRMLLAHARGEALAGVKAGAVQGGPAVAAETLQDLLRGAASSSDAAELGRHLADLAQHWLTGADVEWKGLDSGRRGRAALPTYPFERQRFWHLDVGAAAVEATPGAHPLLGAQLPSALQLVQHMAVVSADTPAFLRDHQVLGEVVFPATGYLEVALAGAQQALGAGAELEDVVIEQALELPGRRRLQLVLSPDAAGNLSFEIYSQAADGTSAEWTRHVQGRARRAADASAAPQAIESIEALLRSMPRQVSAAELYPRLSALGLQYGPAFQGVQALHGGRGEALGRVRLPAAAGDASLYACHPALLDACLHVVVGLDLEEQGLSLPVGVDRLRLLGPLPEEVWAHVRLVQSGAGYTAVDVRVLSPEGVVLCELAGLRLQHADRAALSRAATSRAGSWLYGIGFEISDVRPDAEAAGSWVLVAGSERAQLAAAVAAELEARGGRCVVAGADVGPALASAATLGPVRGVVELGGAVDAPVWTAVEARYGRLLEVLKAVATTPHAPGRLFVVTVGAQAASGGDAIAPVESGIWGMARVAAAEHPELACRRVDLAPPVTPSALVDELLRSDGETDVALRGGGRLVARLKRSSVSSSAPAELRAERDGAYLITGGLGGLGLVFAAALARAGAGAVALLGRRAPDEQARGKIAEIEALGTRVLTVQCDVSRRAELEAALAKVRAELPALRGVLHAAGTLDDGVLMQQSWERFAKVLEPKVLGAWNLHELVHERLDWFVLFSSAASVIGSPGQSNYAAANGFLDGLAASRRALGKPALSVNWGPWAEVGMAAAQERKDAVARNTAGAVSIDPENGVRALALALAAEQAQVVVLPIDGARLAAALGDRRPPFLSEVLAARPGARPSAPSALRDELVGLERGERRRRLQAYLVQTLSALLGVQTVDPTTPFRQLGMDSLMTVEARNRLSEALGVRLSPTLLFDYPHVQALSEHLEGLIAGASGAAPKAAAARARARSVSQEPIAIVGIGCRFPGGANGPQRYWELLRAGFDANREVPPERWDAEATYDPTPATPGKTNTKRASFIEGIDNFAASFFDVSPSQAVQMDPQHRLAVEVVWEALQDAGIAPRKLMGTATGMFLGQMTHDYAFLMKYSFSNLGTGSGTLSFIYDFRGPTETVDVQCASSLAAVHRAAEALRAGECSTALAGGSNALLVPDGFVSLSQVTATSADGRCKTFDERADGYGRGEGCGFVVLKRLSDAERDGDHVYAVILGSGVHHGGRSQGFTVPNGLQEEALLSEVLERTGVKVGEVAYLEAHGTGTSLGDPIEVEAVSRAYAGRDGQRLPVSSTKTNVGHLEGAAGVAGLIKAALVLEHREVPPHLHLQQTNPHISLEALPLTVPTERRPLRDPKVVGVSSFGMSGTLAHALLGAPPRRRRHEAPSGERAPVLSLTLSARTDTALRALAGRFASALRSQTTAGAEALCAAANRAQPSLEHRLAWVGSDGEALRRALVAHSRGERAELVYGQPGTSSAPLAWFLAAEDLPVLMESARELYDRSPVFRGAFDACAAAARGLVETSLLEAVRGEKSKAPAVGWLEAAQVASGYALGQVLLAWGLSPAHLAGSGLGQYLAAALAGVLRVEDALALAVERGRVLAAGSSSTALESFGKRARAMTYQPAQIGLLLGPAAEGGAPSPEYWERELVQPSAGQAKLPADVNVLRAAIPSWSRLLETVLVHWAQGGALEVQLLGRAEVGYKVPLPTYPFERTRYWPGVAPTPEQKPSAERDELADVLSRVESMSPEEIERILKGTV